MGFEDNEISKNAAGGTELAKWSLAPLIPANLLNETQIIASRIRDLDESKIRILWLHDLPEDPESSKLKDPEYRAKFHHFVFVSNWQYQRYRDFLGMPYSSDLCTVIPVGISPAPALTKNYDKIKLVYTSTPQRGLDILVGIFDAYTKNNPDVPVELDVFSSYKIYGWNDGDKPYEELFDFCRNHPKINYKGFVPNEELRKSLNNSHIFAYPSTWMETSCRAMVEAMSAGLICVHPNYGALPETSCGRTMMYSGDSDKGKHGAVFYQALSTAINLSLDKREDVIKSRNAYANTIKFHVDNIYHLNKAAMNWTNLLGQLNELYPTPESRKLPVPTFNYKTN